MLNATTTTISKRRMVTGATSATGAMLLFCVFVFAFQLLQQQPLIFADAFTAVEVVRSAARTTNTRQTVAPTRRHSDYPYSTGRSALFAQDDDDDDDDNNTSDINKFDMAQRIESLKSVVLGALSGGIAVTPIAYLHYVYFADAAASNNNGIAQWEFVTDMSSLQAALFAIVYRYAVRANDSNPMLNQGVVGAFVVVRTLSNIQVTDTCQSIPLRCKSYCSSIRAREWPKLYDVMECFDRVV